MFRLARWLLVAFALALASACGAAARGTDGPGGGSCIEREHTTPAQLADSPRADRDLEVLAATLGGTVAADPAIYDRLARDVGAARAADPSIAHVSYRTGHDGRTLMLEMDSIARARVLAGQDPTFEALRSRLGPLQVDTPYDWVTVGFDRVFDLSRVRDYYLRIPGMTDIGFNVLMGDGPTMCVDRADDDDAWTYWFLDAGGDCPAGCTTMRVVGLRTDRAGTLTWLGASDTEGASAPGFDTSALTACFTHATARASTPTPICD